MSRQVVQADAIAQAVILDGYNEILESSPGCAVVAHVKIFLKLFRPRVEVHIEANEASYNSETATSDLESISMSGQPAKTVDRRRGFQVVFTYVASLMMHEMGTTQSTSKEEEDSDFWDPLPVTTIQRISAMGQTLMVKFDGTAGGLLTSHLTTRWPSWAGPIRDHLLAKGQLTVLFEQSTELLSNIKALHSKFETSDDPIDVIKQAFIATEDVEDGSMDSNDDNEDDSDIVKPFPISANVLGFEAPDAFRSLQEYATILSIAAERDRIDEVRRIKRYEAHSRKLILVQTTKPEINVLNHFYHGLITKPRDNQCCLQAGDTLELQWRGSAKWQATVAEDRGIQRDGYIAIYVTRGKVANSGRYDKETPGNVINALGLSKDQLNRAVKTNPGWFVHVKVTNCDRMYANIRCSLGRIGNLRFSRDISQLPASTYQERVAQLLLAQRPDLLPVKDLYQHVCRGLPDEEPLAFMNGLNPRQVEVVSASRHIPGGLQLVQGPPGTGKTFLAHQMAAPFFASEENSLLLFGAPTNHGADDLARGLYEVLADLQVRYPFPWLAGTYVLRIHSKLTEFGICCTQPMIAAKESSAVVRNEVDAAQVAQEIGDAHEDIFEELKAGAAAKFEGVSDRRVQHLDYSVGMMMLMISGAIPGTRWAFFDEQLFAGFRSLHQKQTKGHLLNAAEEASWSTDCEILFAMAVRGASAIVGTTAGITSADLLSLIAGKVSAIFLDENAFEREDHLAPLFAADFELDPCFVLIGDQEQLAPMTKAEITENPFQPQLSLSLMARQMKVGMEYIMLNEQYRMVEDIVAIANTLTYGDELISGPSTSIVNRPIARVFQEYTKALTGSSTSRLMINVPEGEMNWTVRSKGLSKCNCFLVCVVESIVLSLLSRLGRTATIAILTPYNAQKFKYENMVGRMKALKLPNADKLVVDSFDSCQGRQYDIVLTDLPVDGSVGFCRDSKRGNVGMTRARDGLILVCDAAKVREGFKELAGGKKPYPHYLAGLFKMFQGRTWVRPKQDDFPTTRYYTPDRDAIVKSKQALEEARRERGY